LIRYARKEDSEKGVNLIENEIQDIVNMLNERYKNDEVIEG
jgi:hypothetical protein